MACTVIAEIAQAHDGSLGAAHAYIDAAARAGADAIKFQTHIAEAESTPGEPWRVKFSYQDATRYDYWKRMEFEEEQWRGLFDHARELGLQFISSPFSIEAVELLERTGISAWKIASGEVTNIPMLERIAASGKPVILSSGMSSWAELDRAVETIQRHGPSLTVLQCTSEYPCPPEKIGLNLIPALRERYGCSVGLSDHSGTIFPGLAAAVLGIDALEVHLAMSREMFGPDVPASVTTEELKQLVTGIRFIERMLAHPLDKDGVAKSMAPMRQLFTKSVVARQALPAGTALREEMLTAKKPGTGIPVEHLPRIVGRRLRLPISADEQLRDEHLEPLP